MWAPFEWVELCNNLARNNYMKIYSAQFAKSWLKLSGTLQTWVKNFHIIAQFAMGWFDKATAIFPKGLDITRLTANLKKITTSS